MQIDQSIPTISSFHVMAKPTGARCNLRCDYCYFLKKKSMYQNRSFLMSDTIMECFVRQTISAHNTPSITIAWQGGEPTLMGIDFFRRVVKIEKKYLTPGKRLENSFQTNGVLLNEEWCLFLKENNFLVGLSLDGPAEFHDAFRKDRNGRSVFNKVSNAVKLLHRYNIEFNILCTVNAINCHCPMEVYHFFRDELEVQYLQFIPIVERDNANGNQQGNKLTKRSVPSESYGKFLIEIFDEWVSRDVGSMFIQLFDSVLESYVYGYSSLCVFQPTCGLGVALEHNGDLYACDHYVEPDYFLGNIMYTTIDKLIASEKQRQFGQAKKCTLPTSCKNCEFLFTCYGECPKNRVLDVADGSGKLNWLCTGLKLFFSHTKEAMKEMAGLLQKGCNAAEIMNIQKAK